MRKIIIAVLTFLALPFGLVTANVVAADENSKVDYNIQPILPANQIDRGNTFYDLLVTPGSEQTIKVQINNFSEDEHTFNISVNTAETNGNLIIDYTGKTKMKVGDKPIDLAKIVSYPKSVQIPAKKAGVVSIDIKIPATAFDGIALGGIHIEKDTSKEKVKANTIASKYDYVLGLMLSENTNAVEPNLQLSNVETAAISNNAGITAELENPTPINISKVHMVGNIYTADNQTTPIITREIKDGGIAPNSIFKVNFFNGEVGTTKPLETGDYILKMNFKDVNNKEWTFEKPFSITKRQASAVNNKVFIVKKDNTLLYIIIGILLAILLVGLFFLIILWKKVSAE